MRDLARYFLALLVVGTGFYAAWQHRRPEQHPQGEAVASRAETDVMPPRDGRESPATETSGALPVAALADIDRVPLPGPDRANIRGKSAETSVNSVTRPPTLRADKSAADATTPKPAKEKEPVADAAERDAKKQASAKPSPKKQEKKKTATAASVGTGQSTADTGEKTLAGKKATESGKPMRQDAERDGFPGTVESAQKKDPVPPEFAHEYRPHFQFAEDASNRTSASPSKSPPQKDNRSSQADKQPTASKSPSTAPPRRHRVVEGDTLPRLAEKYLGSRDRYLELFQINSEVLFDPRLIPIGVEIVIPDRTTVVAHAASTPTKAAVTGKGDSENEAAEKDDASKYDYLWDTSVQLPGMADN